MANPALIDELEKQFRDNPRRVFARLANEYRKGGDFMRAIEICHAHVPQQPGYISGHIVLGQALYDAGELDQAQQTFQAALALDPENLIALRQLGDISRSRRDFRDARGWYTRLLEVDPQNEEIVAQLGELALSEDAHGTRNGDSRPAPEAELEESATSVAVADEEEQASGAPALVDDAAAEAMVSDSVVQRLDAPAHEPADETMHGYFANGDGQHDSASPMLDIEDLEVEPSYSVPDGLTRAGGDPASSNEDDEEIAWVAAEGSEETDLVLEYEQLDEKDGTEFLIAEDASDEPDARGAEDGDEFDLAFEPEEYETPLRPHTGESLSVIAEEDALAGVHARQWEERSPFGDSLDANESSDSRDASASFEPLPASEIDASAGELPRVNATLEEVNGAREATPPDAANGSSGSDRDAERVDVFDLSDAETLVDDASAAFAWGDAPGETEPETVSAWEREAPRPDDEPLIDWDPVSSGTPDTGVPVAESSEREDSAVVEEPSSPASATPELAMEPRDSEEPASTESAELDFTTADGPDEPRADSEPDATEGNAARDTESPEPDETGDAPEVYEAAHAPEPYEAEQEPEDDEAERAPEPHEAHHAPEDDEAEQAPEHDDAPVEQATGAASAFVTETMARLYLQQGFRTEALEVYRKLAVQSPDDEELRERIAELEGAAAPADAGSGAESSGERAPGSRTAASFFRALASKPAPVAPPPATIAPPDFGAWVDDALSDAGDISDADQAAATALAHGFSPEPPQSTDRGGATRAADREMSLHDVFGSGQKSNQPIAGSMEAFFTPEGERAQESSGQEEGHEDLEAFNAWLEGLKK